MLVCMHVRVKIWGPKRAFYKHRRMRGYVPMHACPCWHAWPSFAIKLLIRGFPLVLLMYAVHHLGKSRHPICPHFVRMLQKLMTANQNTLRCKDMKQYTSLSMRINSGVVK